MAHYAILMYYAILCHAISILHCTNTHYAVLYHTMPHHATLLHYTIQIYAILYYVVLCYVKQYRATPYHTIYRYLLSVEYHILKTELGQVFLVVFDFVFY